ncbi:MAG: hypothetical protein KME37_09725 [Candidatus Thiodiazotropha sp. (ex Codakia orbicularis)]|nr:hypothetical protein [Candidatus Thiodiazotropha sp. (ex Codakia orbicularis)]
MPTKKDKKREAPISYRPPAHLREEFSARVERSGLSTSAFITQAIFGGTPSRRSRRPPVEQKLLAHLLSEAAKIHSELERIDYENSKALQAQIETAVEELTVIRAALLKAMGRQP